MALRLRLATGLPFSQRLKKKMRVRCSLNMTGNIRGVKGLHRKTTQRGLGSWLVAYIPPVANKLLAILILLELLFSATCKAGGHVGCWYTAESQQGKSICCRA